MKKSLIMVLILFCAVLALLSSGASAAEVVLEPLQIDLKAPVEGAVYQDDAFFEEADKVINSLSNRTIPTGSQRMKVYGAYTSLRDMSISPANYETARTALAFLYYTAKAGEAYENYFDEKKSVAATTDGSEFYDLARTYYQVSSNWWALIADRYPKVHLYSLPDQDDPYPEDDSGIGTVLEGLKYPLIMPQITPDSSKPYQDDEIKTTIQRWIEDNIEAIPNQTDLGDQSVGNYFITSDGLKWAKNTYMGISTKNVKPDFYDTANYINAFLYFLSQAREYYDQYKAERTSILEISDGQKPYDLSKTYYDQAGVALSRFKDQVPEINSSTTLPAFPKLDEVAKGRQTMQELEDYWGGTSWTGGNSFN